MKKFIVIICLLLYVIFNQFFIKAWVSLAPSIAEVSDITCMQKKLDTYESKYNCRKKNTISLIRYTRLELIEDVTYIGLRSINDHITYLLYAKIGNLIISEQYTLPPYQIPINNFLKTYLGSSFILVYD